MTDVAGGILMIFDLYNIDFEWRSCHCRSSCQHCISNTRRGLTNGVNNNLNYIWCGQRFRVKVTMNMWILVYLEICMCYAVPNIRHWYTGYITGRLVLFYSLFYSLSFYSWLCFDSSRPTVHIPWAGNDRDCPWNKRAWIPCYFCRQKWPVRATFFGCPVSFFTFKGFCVFFCLCVRCGNLQKYYSYISILPHAVPLNIYKSQFNLNQIVRC